MIFETSHRYKQRGLNDRLSGNEEKGCGFVLLLYVFLILLMQPTPCSSASIGGFELFPENEMYLDNPYWSIAVVTVDQVISKGLVEEGRLMVDEVLRGKKVEVIHRAYWSIPPSQNLDQILRAWENDPNRKANEWYQRGVQKSLHAGPLKTPEVGDRLIVVFLRDCDVIKDPVKLVSIYKFSDNNRMVVLKNMAPGERGGFVQYLLLFLILIIPAFIFIAKCGKSSQVYFLSRKITKRCLIFFLFIFQFCIYAFYECGISFYTNIRIDLFLVWPALLVSVVLVLAEGSGSGLMNQD